MPRHRVTATPVDSEPWAKRVERFPFVRGHILLHGRDATFLDVEKDDRTSKQEREADTFAERVLFPKAAEDEYRQIEPIRAHVVELARRHGLHPGIVVGRLQHDDRLPWNQLSDLKIRYTWT
ncbi:MAG: hypothetical protein R3B99_20215 [Polyangiales bacterium]